MAHDRLHTSGGVPGFWRAAAAQPERIAVVDVDGTAITAGDLLARVNRVSNAILREGIAPGDDVAVLTRNGAGTLALVLACAQVGVYHTMVNSHLAAPEVAYILADSAPRLLFVDGRTAALAHEAIGLVGMDAGAVRCLDEGHGFATVDDWSGDAPSEAPPTRTFGPVMLYTSGTSGRPKGVRPPRPDRTPEEAAEARAGLLRRYGIDPPGIVGDGVHLVTSPLYHAAPLANAAIALDLAHLVVLMDRFDAATTLRLIDEHRVTWTHVVPTMMRRMLELPEEVRRRYDTSSLRWFIHAAAPCPVPVKRRMIEWLGPVVWEYYSSTEGGGTVIGPEDWLAHPGSVGRPWPGTDVRILDDEGNDVPPGEIGTIYVLNTRPFVYHNDPEKTASVRRGDYITAGDLGYVDEEGYLYIADRRTDLILSGGVNIYPKEIEDVLVTHPAVADAAVIGRPDPDLGEVPHAVIEPRDPAADLDALRAELATFLAERLSPQKHPRSYALRATLPRNEAGKLLRRQLREELAGAETS